MKLIQNALIITTLLNTQALANNAILPPLKPWHGASEKLIAKADDVRLTPAEKMQLTDTPNYQQSMAYLTKLANSEPMYQLVNIGKSAQGRDLTLLLASTEGFNTLEQFNHSNKPTLFIQAGIHAGEIDGKDAMFMLLRDISKQGKQALLNNINIAFLPMFNADGHERKGKFNRVNQRGPEHMGWRTTAQNLNLNRDYAKADTPEMQALMSAINQIDPSLYIDVHVTDGEDYQYDITYGFNGEHGNSPHISRWLATKLKPSVDQALKQQGHLAGPLVFGIDAKDFAKGLFGWTAGVRFSNGWGDMRQLPTILVENHSLKPYKQRVLGTYVFLEQVMKQLATEQTSLKQAIELDKQQTAKTITLDWSVDREHPEYIDFAGIDYEKRLDQQTQIPYIYWNGKAKHYKNLPVYWQRVPKLTIDMPKYIYIPTQYQQVVNRLKMQGIKLTQLTENTNVTVSQFSASEPKFSKTPFEGHMTVTAKYKPTIQRVELPANTWVIDTQQPLAKLAVALLDPRAPDSLMFWGFFNQIFQRTEYIESYAVVPLAKQMLAENPKLLAEFKKAFPEQNTASKNTENKVENIDSLFNQQANEKLMWFYQRSPYYDQQYLKYPVLFQY